MSSYRDEVRDLALGTLWSLWVELGLSGWERRHQSTTVDLEPLILATARAEEWDPRLLEEALDWCIVQGRIASAVRFKHLAAAAGDATRQDFGRFAATVNAHAPLRWPSAGVALRVSRTGRSAAPDLSRPALLQLRLRALWGVNARAEVLRVMLPEGGRFMGVSEVSLATAYGKDAVSDALDSLHRGGLLARAGRANQYLYRLVREDELRALVGPLPPQPKVDWSLALPVMVGMLEAADLPEIPPLARAAELHRQYRAWQPSLTRMGNTVWPQGAGEEFVAEYEEWSLRLLRWWAGDGT